MSGAELSVLHPPPPPPPTLTYPSLSSTCNVSRFFSSATSFLHTHLSTIPAARDSIRLPLPRSLIFFFVLWLLLLGRVS